MKRIMFNDKYGLTQAVLDGRKTITRRIVKLESTLAITWDCYTDFDKHIAIKDYITKNIQPKYKVDEVVAIAQNYTTIFHAGNCPDDFFMDSSTINKKYCGAGFKNKMFVSAALMSHHIRITNIKVERLQDISNEDCLKEGIQKWADVKNVKDVAKYGGYTNGDWDWFETPRKAFSALIDKLSGKDTWERNPYVFAYSFERVD